MLFAGHGMYLPSLVAIIKLNIPLETTAYTLAATLGLLALNQDSQDEVFQHIEEVVGHDRDPVRKE